MEPRMFQRGKCLKSYLHHLLGQQVLSQAFYDGAIITVDEIDMRITTGVPQRWGHSAYWAGRLLEQLTADLSVHIAFDPSYNDLRSGLLVRLLRPSVKELRRIIDVLLKEAQTDA